MWSQMRSLWNEVVLTACFIHLAHVVNAKNMVNYNNQREIFFIADFEDFEVLLLLQYLCVGKTRRVIEWSYMQHVKKETTMFYKQLFGKVSSKLWIQHTRGSPHLIPLCKPAFLHDCCKVYVVEQLLIAYYFIMFPLKQLPF